MAKPVDDDPVAKARAALSALAPKAPGSGKASKYDAVKALYPEIVNARQTLHYTDSELVAMLSTNGIEITLGTFRAYMQRIARETNSDNPAKPSVKPSERKANANANIGANVKTNETPKPSEVAAKAAPTGKPNGGKLGHKLDADDV